MTILAELLSLLAFATLPDVRANPQSMTHEATRNGYSQLSADRIRWCNSNGLYKDWPADAVVVGDGSFYGPGGDQDTCMVNCDDGKSSCLAYDNDVERLD